MNETNHPARRLRHGERPTEPLVFEDVAANKAAEEGGLPNDEILKMDCLRVAKSGSDYDISSDSVIEFARKIIAADRASRQVTGSQELLAELAEAADVFMKGGVAPLRQKIDQAKLFCAGITEGSASRQVANKAEVEPLTATHGPIHLTNRKTAEIAGTDYNIVGYVLRREDGDAVCISAESAVRWLPEAHYWRLMHEQDGSLFATPPATTGASTAQANGYLNVIENLESQLAECMKVTEKWASAAGEADGRAFKAEEEVLSLHRQLAAEKLRADQGWERAEAKSRECLDLRERMASSVGASTVLTDERTSINTPAFKEFIDALVTENYENYLDFMAKFIAHIDQHVAREVAAQAGQVAVPGWISTDDRLPENGKDVIILYWPYNNLENERVAGTAHHVEGTFYDEDGNDMHPPSHWMPFVIPATAPSPAKESK